MSSTTAESTSDPVPATEPPAVLPPAKPPVGTGTSPLWAQLLAVGLIALGVALVRDALVTWGALGGSTWTGWLLSHGDGVAPATWMVPVGVVAALLGLLLLLVVLRPRPRTSLAVSATTGVYLRSGDLARICETLVEGTPGVTDVSCSSSRRRVKVAVRTVEDSADNGTLTETVRSRLTPCLEALDHAPRVAVDITNEAPA